MEIYLKNCNCLVQTLFPRKHFYFLESTLENTTITLLSQYIIFQVNLLSFLGSIVHSLWLLHFLSNQTQPTPQKVSVPSKAWICLFHV